MKIKTFSDIGFSKDESRIDKLDDMVNNWLAKNEDIDVIFIQRNEYTNSYVTIVYEE